MSPMAAGSRSISPAEALAPSRMTDAQAEHRAARLMRVYSAMFPIANIRINIGECGPGKPPVPASCRLREEIRLPSGRERHDELLDRTAQPVAGRCFFRCIYVECSRPAACRSAGRRRRTCRCRPASAGVADDRTSGQRGRCQARAGCAAAAAGCAGQAADGKAEAAARLQHRGLRRRHGQCPFARRRRQGHGVRRQPPRRQGLWHRQQGRQTFGQGGRVRPLPSERRRLQERHALHRRTVEGLQDRQGRGQSGQPAEADHDLRQSAQGRSPRLEVHRDRSRQQALRSGRSTRQQRAA